MANEGPIVIVDDDKDDQDIIREVLLALGTSNELMFFNKASNAFDYLKAETKQVFIIFCDINLPGKNGLVFKRQIDDDAELRRKSIPFVFLSTNANKETVTEAYATMTVQGFFKKGESTTEIQTALSLIMDYWRLCRHPNSDY